MAYSFDGTEADRHETQYFEMFCNRGVYHHGWTAVTNHSVPWVMGALPPFADDVWELYDTNTDWSRRTISPPRCRRSSPSCNSPGSMKPASQRAPARRPAHRALQRRARRPPGAVSGNSQLLFGGMGRLSENSLLNIKNKSHAVTARSSCPSAEGVILAQGGAFAGWSLYAKDGRPTYCYNLLGLQRFKIEADAAILPGTHPVRMEFAYDGGGPGQGRHRIALPRRRQDR